MRPLIVGGASGDFNIRVSQALADLNEVRWAPTFAFIGQFDSEVHWSTLEPSSYGEPSSYVDDQHTVNGNP